MRPGATSKRPGATSKRSGSVCAAPRHSPHLHTPCPLARDAERVRRGATNSRRHSRSLSPLVVAATGTGRGRGGRGERLGAVGAGAEEDLVAPQLSEVEESVIVEAEDSRIVFRIGGFINVHEVEALTEKVGWPKRNPHKVKLALENSFMVTALYKQALGEDGGDVESEKLIGCIRVTSDTVFNATLWDVTVDPEYQGEGLGKTLMEMTIRKLCRLDIRTISLFAEPDVLQFYRKIGFRQDPQGIRAMFWYPRR